MRGTLIIFRRELAGLFAAPLAWILLFVALLLNGLLFSLVLNHFALTDGERGPYHLHLSIQDNRLVLQINDTKDQPITRHLVPVTPYRRLIKDYFTVCESYFEAIKRSSPSKIEAIDMGRRALHDEGAEKLCDQLAGKIEIDKETARRLFTLICVLHIRG